MQQEKLIKEIQPRTKVWRFLRKFVLNKYSLTISFFLLWMIFLDSNSFLVINELNQEVSRYEDQLQYYQQEYKKNNDFYKKLMNNKDEKEKYARENYFMKKPNEEIFIMVVDSSKISKKTAAH